MKLTDRINRAYNAFRGKGLGNSTGLVARNYNQVQYRPEKLTGIAYKAVDKIGLTLSSYKPEVLKANGDKYTNHPLYNLFLNPNPKVNSSSDFIHLYGMQMEIYGETFWYMARGENTRKPKEVYLLNPQYMELVIHEGELVGYVMNKLDGARVPFELDEILHDKIPNPFNEWRGQSILEKASVYINTEVATSHFTLNYIQNNASPSGIVSLPDMDKETFKLFASQWRENYEGPENAGKTAFIRGGEAQFKAVGATLKDIDQKITREMAKEDVLMMLDVPKSMLGSMDSQGLGRASIETLEYSFAKNKLEPMMRRLDKNFEMIGSELAQGALTVTHESPIPEDKEHKHKMMKDFLNRAMTVNEVRAELGLDPLPNGDELVPMNAVPMTNSLKKVSLKKQAPEMSAEEFRQRLEDIAEKYIPIVEQTIVDFFDDQKTKVLNKIDASNKAFDEWLFEIKAESEELARLLAPVMEELLEEQVKNTDNWLTGEEVNLTPEIKRDVTDRIIRIAGVKNEEVYRALETTISEGVRNGESLNKIRKRIESVYEPFVDNRTQANRIARTESIRASNRANELIYKNNGYTTVRWFANPGACAYCSYMDGREKEVGVNFVNIGDTVDIEDDEGNVNQLAINYDDVDVPPLHPNCRCSVSPVR